MNVEIREFPEQTAVCMPHSGPYYLIGATFRKLGVWLHEHNVSFLPGIGLYYDDPTTTPESELHSDAGAIVAPDFTTDDPAVHVVKVAGGTYAVATYLGPYEGLPAAWGELMGTWLPNSGHLPEMKTPFELYLNDCQSLPPAEWLTELYVAIKPAAVPAR